MTYPPPVAANGDYSSRFSQNVTYLPPTAAGGAGPGPDADGVFAAASPHPEYADGPAGPAGPVARVAGYRPLHRADRAEHPGISWSAARPGPAQMWLEEAMNASIP